MSAYELHEAAKRGDMDEVERILDEEGVDVNQVSVCVLCLLILVLFGIVRRHCSHSFL